MVRVVDTKVVNRTAELKGLTPVESASVGKPAVAFEKDSKPHAPQVRLSGNPLFAARGDMYRDMTPAQRASFMRALEGCKDEVISVYGKNAYSAAEALLKEVMEFTGKAPA
ncbi:MAG: hypothetical protein WC683_00095 [bacterium]